MSSITKLVRATSCPSKITLSIASLKRCGNCGVLGHNRRTCQVPENYAAICHPTPAPKATGSRKCGACGLMGHIRRSCGATPAPVVAKVKSFTSPQLFSRLPNYIAPAKKDASPILEGLRGCNLFRKTVKKSSGNRDKLSESEMRVAIELSAIL